MGNRPILFLSPVLLGLCVWVGGCSAPAPRTETTPAPKVEPPAPKEEAKPDPTPPPSGQTRFRLQDEVLQFGPGQAKLSPGGIEEVRKVAKELATRSASFVLEVTGYTSADGGHAANRVLSRRRAESVARVLEEAGIPKDRIRIRGMGPADPIGDNATAEGRTKNRRVEIEVKTPE